MAFDINELRTNQNLEKEGVWVDEQGGLRLKIARLDNPDYKRAIARMSKPYRRQITRGDFDRITSQMDDIVREAFARHILLGWENLTEGGKAVEFSYENAYRLLGIKDFFEIVESHAMNAELFKQEIREDSEKNS